MTDSVRRAFFCGGGDSPPLSSSDDSRAASAACRSSKLQKREILLRNSLQNAAVSLLSPFPFDFICTHTPLPNFFLSLLIIEKFWPTSLRAAHDVIVMKNSPQKH